MTKSEIDLIRRALDLLHKLVPDDEPRAVDPPRRSPVATFAKRFLARQAGADVTSCELWQFFTEIVAAGELEPLTKPEFQRALPGAMEATFGVKRCHSIRRDGKAVRGFKSVTVREQALPANSSDIEPEWVTAPSALSRNTAAWR